MAPRYILPRRPVVPSREPCLLGWVLRWGRQSRSLRGSRSRPSSAYFGSRRADAPRTAGRLPRPGQKRHPATKAGGGGLSTASEAV
jgi:hypothetical protein